MNKTMLLTGMGLLIGLAAGAWAMRLYFDRTLMTWNPTDRMLLELSGDLQLNPEQRAKAAVILASQKDRMEELRRQWRSQVVALDRQGEDEIAALLTGKQIDRFMKLHDQIHVRMDRLLWITNSEASAIAIGPPGK